MTSDTNTTSTHIDAPREDVSRTQSAHSTVPDSSPADTKQSSKSVTTLSRFGNRRNLFIKMRDSLNRCINSVIRYFEGKDETGKKARRQDARDNGKRYRNLMLTRTFVVALLISAPWYELSHHGKSPIPSPSVSAHNTRNTANQETLAQGTPVRNASGKIVPEERIKPVNYSEFLGMSEKKMFTKALIVVDSSWQIAIATLHDKSRVEVAVPSNVNIVNELKKDGVSIQFTTPEALTRGIMSSPLIQEILHSFIIIFVEFGSMALMFLAYSRWSNRKFAHPQKVNSDLSLNDVAGIDDIRQDLQEIVDFIREGDETYLKNGAYIPRGWRFTGPPGTGKTMTAEAIAAESGCAFFKVSGSSFTEMFVGVGASRARNLKKAALKHAQKTGKPSLVFIDEADAVAGLRGRSNSHSENDNTLNALLVEVQGTHEKEPIIWIAATNMLSILDPAFLRRFDKAVGFHNPDIMARRKIVSTLANKKNLEISASTMEDMAANTAGFSGDALAKLFNEACLSASRRGHIGVEDIDFHVAMDKKIMGMPRGLRLGRMTTEEKICTAHHEAGHALIATILEKMHPVYKATIIPHGMESGEALGMVVTKPERDIFSYSHETMFSILVKMMAGRAAEYLLHEHDSLKITSGASGDISQATALAYDMASSYGMGKRNGFLGLSSVKVPSQEMLKLIEDDAREIIENAYKKAVNTLTDYYDAWKALAHALLEHETLDGQVVVDIIKQHPPRSEVSETQGPTIDF